jgi:hypothetical protein
MQDTKDSKVPQQPNAPKQAVDGGDQRDAAPSEQPNPGDPGPPVLRPDEKSTLPKPD